MPATQDVFIGVLQWGHWWPSPGRERDSLRFQDEELMRRVQEQGLASRTHVPSPPVQHAECPLAQEQAGRWGYTGTTEPPTAAL